MPVKLTSRLGEIAKQADRRTQDAVDDALRSIQAGARARARVRTGRMRAGIQARSTRQHEGVVEGKAPYTIYNEYGTRNMPAQPMLTPAAEAAREPFQQAVREAWDG